VNIVEDSIATHAEGRPGIAPAGIQRELHWDDIDRLSNLYGETFFVFDEPTFRGNYAHLYAAFSARYPDIRVAYSYKTNYTPNICRIVDELGGYAEVVSEMEYDLAKAIGVKGNHIIYNGPYKTTHSVRSALQSGAIVNLDSMCDYLNVMLVASESPDREFVVGIRCNFLLAGSERTRFGVDVDALAFQQIVEGIRHSRNVSLGGLQCHFAARDLNSFRARASAMVGLAKRVFPEPPLYIDMGGGFYGEMPVSLKSTFSPLPPDFDQYAEVVCEAMTGAYSGSDRMPALYIEPGTALVANTVKFYTKIIDIKTIAGRRIATVTGSIFDISPYARAVNLPVRAICRQEPTFANETQERFDIAGYTCIESDYLTMGLRVQLEVGDFLEYSNVGSYTVVMKPPFIAPHAPILQSSGKNAEFCMIRSRGTGAAILGSFLDF